MFWAGTPAREPFNASKYFVITSGLVSARFLLIFCVKRVVKCLWRERNFFTQSLPDVLPWRFAPWNSKSELLLGWFIDSDGFDNEWWHSLALIFFTAGFITRERFSRKTVNMVYSRSAYRGLFQFILSQQWHKFCLILGLMMLYPRAHSIGFDWQLTKFCPTANPNKSDTNYQFFQLRTHLHYQNRNFSC